MQEYGVRAFRQDAHGSTASTKAAALDIDTDPGGRQDRFSPAELLLAALAGCIIKGHERVSPMISFKHRGIEVPVRASRQDTPPLLVAIDYEIIVDTDESDRRLALLRTKHPQIWHRVEHLGRCNPPQRHDKAKAVSLGCGAPAVSRPQQCITHALKPT